MEEKIEFKIDDNGYTGIYFVDNPKSQIRQEIATAARVSGFDSLAVVDPLAAAILSKKNGAVAVEIKGRTTGDPYTDVAPEAFSIRGVAADERLSAIAATSIKVGDTVYKLDKPLPISIDRNNSLSDESRKNIETLLNNDEVEIYKSFLWIRFGKEKITIKNTVVEIEASLSPDNNNVRAAQQQASAVNLSAVAKIPNSSETVANIPNKSVKAATIA